MPKSGPRPPSLDNSEVALKIDAITEIVGDVPSAVSMAVSYCQITGVSSEEYRRRLNNDTIKCFRISNDSKRPQERSIYQRIFALSLQEVTKLHPAAKPLISFAVLLPTKPIPLSLFSEGRNLFGQDLANVFTEDGISRAVAALQAFALVNQDVTTNEDHPSISAQTLHLDPIIHNAAAFVIEEADRTAALSSLIAGIVNAYPEKILESPENWPKAEQLDPFAMALVGPDAVLPPGAEANASELMERLGSYRRRALGKITDAARLYERALSLRTAAFGPEHPETAKSLNLVGEILQIQGQWDKALEVLLRALRIRENLDPDHPDTAQVLNNIALAFYALGNSDAAKTALRRALTIREQRLGADHPDTAMTLLNCGVIVQPEDPDTARWLYRRALKIQETKLGNWHPVVAETLDNLGALMLQQEGDLAAAQLFLERALAIRLKVFGRFHVDTALTCRSLASLHASQNDFLTAEALLNDALDIRQNIYGAEHIYTAMIKHDLGFLFLQDNQTEKALKCFKEILPTLRKELGSKHHLTKTVGEALAACRAKSDDFSRRSRRRTVRPRGH